MSVSINELFNSWINWPDSWNVDYYDEEIEAASASSEARSAMDKVFRAVRRGELPNLKEEFVRCTDCKSRAMVYDHRNYEFPLEVSPVCMACNWKRGAA